MSEFEKWFRSLNANGKTVYFLGNEHKVSEMAWNHQQTIIDNLKTQLNNMEACYIGKKKVEELQGRIDEALEDLEYPTAPWDETIASVVKVLRGDND